MSIWDFSHFSRMKRIFIFLSIGLAVCACRQNATEDGSQDTIEEPELLTKVYEHLADTSYESASALDYQISYADSADYPVVFDDSLYNESKGVFMFRGTAFRNNPGTGTIAATPTSFRIEWEFTTDTDYTPTVVGSWGGGSGWTGQPVIVHWPDSLVTKFRNESPSLTEDFAKDEIIAGSLVGKIYFINAQTGTASRKPIDVTNPLKGSISLDPDFNGNLYFGHGVPAHGPMGAGVINLFKHQITDFFPVDKTAFRNWGAYDSSPLVVGDYLFRPGENGKIYKYARSQGRLREIASLRYRVRGAAPGIESSMAAYSNYGYVGDNHGNIICVNLDNLKPVWRYFNQDDTDATIVLAEEDGVPYLYTGCEIDKQGDNGFCFFTKINGLDGTPVWTTKYEGSRAHLATGKIEEGGMYSTPLFGLGDCEGLIFTCFVTNQPALSGNFVAIDRKNGNVVYEIKLDRYAWSSPIAMLTPEGKMYIVQGDCAGKLYMIDAQTGTILFKQQVGNNFESSPAVCGDSFVVGSRGSKFYKVRVVCNDVQEAL